MENKYLLWEAPQTYDLITDSLKNGDVCSTTTDTVPGLLSAITSAGINKLNEIKKRNDSKSYLILVNSRKKLGFFVENDTNDKLQKMIERCWPGPLTLIFKSKQGIYQDTIAVRIPDFKPLLTLLERFDGLFSTSANISGMPVPQHMSNLDPDIIKSVRYVVSSNDSQKVSSSLPSTILDCTGERIKIVREGAYPINELEEIYGEKFIK